MRKLNSILFLLVLLVPAKSFCQSFSHSAKLDDVPRTGFYSIAVTPELSRFLNVNLSDLRIVDAKGMAVAYVHKKESDLSSTYHELPVIENTLNDSGRTNLVIGNNTGKAISEVAFIIRNTAVTRPVNISGSDDGKKWFTIAENYLFTGGNIPLGDRYSIRISFPNSSYRYFKFDINNGRNDPVKIESAGFVLQNGAPLQQILLNPPCSFTSKDSSDGNTYIKVVQPFPYHISGITFDVISPKFFERKMEIIGKDIFAGFMINSANRLFFPLPYFKNTEFTIKIYNGDNPPLQVSRLSTSQDIREIVSYLEKGGQYSLLMGNQGVSSPAYDLENFKDSIPSNLPSLHFKPVQENSRSVVAEESKSNLSLWLIIIGVLALLSFFTWNLTKELKKRNQ